MSCCSYQITMGGRSDYEPIRYLLGVHKDENLTELIGCSHTILNKVIDQLIVEKQGKHGKPKDRNKVKFYAGLVNLPEEQKGKLLAFAKLRNVTAHELVDAHASCGNTCLGNMRKGENRLLSTTWLWRC
jgi:hypothetical protein